MNKIKLSLLIIVLAAFGALALKERSAWTDFPARYRLQQAVQIQERELKTKPVFIQQKALRIAFLEISPEKSSEENLKNLALLAIALNSTILPVQQTAIPLARSLAIDAAYGTFPTDANNRDVLRQILKTYREVAKDEIETRRTGFPNSPMLKYLSSL